MATVNATILPGFDWLIGKAANKYSQFGEDGLVRAVFDRIGTKNEWCFEVGASDGKYLSNSLQWRDEGWNAVLIEADDAQFAKLQACKNARTQVVHEKIGPESLDRILAEAGAPTDMDFGCVDIDGQDYHVWAGMEKYAPRVMLMEIAHQDSPIPQLGQYPGQAGITAMSTLGDSKGYTALARTHCNLVLVKTELLS